MVHRTRRRSYFWFVSLLIIALSVAIGLQSCSLDDGPSQIASDPLEKIAQEHQNDSPSPSEISLQTPAQDVTSREVDYGSINGQPLKGFLTQPADASSPLPGIIAIHEWWGLNDNIKSVSEVLAGEGYSVLAVDLYNGQVVDQPDQAKALVQSVAQNSNAAKDNLRQAYDYLSTEQQAPKVGSIGWCFGGAWSLRTGLLLPQKLDALVIYYGQLETDSDVLAPLEMPIAGFFGGKDTGIPVSSVKAFESSLTALNKTADIHIYDEAGHAFANPSGKRYDPEAAQDAWQKTVAFFAKTLKG